MKRFWKIFIVIVFVVAIYSGIKIYKKIFTPNVQPDEYYINISTGSSLNDVVKNLAANNILKDTASFRWVAKKMKYENNIYPGHYVLTPGMSNKDLVTLLRSGKQTPVNLVFNCLRSSAELASVVSKMIEADSISIVNLLNDSLYLSHYGFNKQTCLSVLIPNTYEFYWNTSAEKFFERMIKEHKKFWTEDRNAKAKTIGLTKIEVSVLASIVEKETILNDEKALIAGVYMNRFKKGWKLEADPTLVFALGNFEVRRVLQVHKEIDSPYNTYMYSGFPPGPICIPSISSLDAVLNYATHDYMFFCARDDFSGYHNFARTYSEHLANARRFQKELNRRNISS